MELWEHQAKAIDMLRHSLKTGHRTPLLQAPTGSGKTVISGEIIRMAREKSKRVAFIVDRLTLVDQASKHLSKIGIDHGIIQADNPFTDWAKPVQVVSIQTLGRKQRPWEFDLGIIDEAHIVFKYHKNLINNWDNIPFVGLSATPFTKGLGQIYDDLIIPTSIRELIAKGYLVDADVYGPSQPDMTGVKVTGGDYNQKQGAERTDKPELIADIIETWHKLAENQQTICFAWNILHSKHIVHQFRAHGVNAVHIDAYTDTADRREAIDRFKAGEIKLLSSVGVLTTGFDAPNAAVGILARPTRSLALHFQMIGRLLRCFDGKEKALILDHAGNYERLGFHTDPTPNFLDMGNKSENTKAKPKEALPKTCPKCKFMKPPKIQVCPKCGFKAEKQNEIKEKDGELKAIKKTNRDTSWDEKIRLISGFKYYAQEKGYKSGWVSHAYKTIMGVWPNDPRLKSASPSPPDEICRNKIKYLNIKRAKSRAA